MPNLPSGTVTFVFSDIEGSTALLKQLGDDAYADVLATHRRLMRETFAAHDGQEIDTQGDAFFYSFRRARSAVAAAIAIQRAHEHEAWPQDVAVRVRLGLHTGEPVVGEEGYTGLDVVRAARIAAVARGGQVLLSETTRSIVAGDLPDDVELRSLGDQRLKDIDRPEPLHELRIPDVGMSARSAPAAVVAGAEPDLSIPALPADRKDMAAWVRDLKERTASFGDLTRRTIEARVLAELDQALPGDHAAWPKPPRTLAPSGPLPVASAQGPPPGRSVAAEIAQLRSLHEAGALTDEQYAKAVDRTIEGPG